MYIIHLADTHINCASVGSEKCSELVAIFESIRHEITKRCISKDKLVAIVAGDVLDIANCNHNASLALASVLIGILEDLCCEVYVMPGNHDVAKDGTTALFPESATLLDGKHVYSSTVDDCSFTFMSPIAEDALNIKSFPKAPQNGCSKHIAVYHGIVGSNVASIFHREGMDYLPSRTPKPADWFDHKGYDIVMLGDIHAPITVKERDPVVAYCGSLYQVSSSESFSGHGFILWNTDDLSMERVVVKQLERPMLQISYTAGVPHIINTPDRKPVKYTVDDWPLHKWRPKPVGGFKNSLPGEVIPKSGMDSAVEQFRVKHTEIIERIERIYSIKSSHTTKVMPIISKIWMHNIFSFGEDCPVVALEDSPGVIRITGDNGSGKSTFIKGLHLCVYGGRRVYPSSMNLNAVVDSIVNNAISPKPRNSKMTNGKILTIASLFCEGKVALLRKELSDLADSAHICKMTIGKDAWIVIDTYTVLGVKPVKTFFVKNGEVVSEDPRAELIAYEEYVKTCVLDDAHALLSDMTPEDLSELLNTLLGIDGSSSIGDELAGIVSNKSSIVRTLTTRSKAIQVKEGITREEIMVGKIDVIGRKLWFEEIPPQVDDEYDENISRIKLKNLKDKVARFSTSVYSIALAMNAPLPTHTLSEIEVSALERGTLYQHFKKEIYTDAVEWADAANRISEGLDLSDAVIHPGVSGEIVSRVVKGASCEFSKAELERRMSANIRRCETEWTRYKNELETFSLDYTTMLKDAEDAVSNAVTELLAHTTYMDNHRDIPAAKSKREIYEQVMSTKSSLEKSLVSVVELEGMINDAKVEYDQAYELAKEYQRISDETIPTIATIIKENADGYLNKFGFELIVENTTMVKRGGKGLKGVVLKAKFSESGRTMPVSLLSGYQRFIIDLAIRRSLSAISMSVISNASNGSSLLFMDESLHRVDAKHSKDMAEVVSQLTKHYSHIFVISHDPTIDVGAEWILKMGGGAYRMCRLA